ncbi:ABC transporter permease [Alicyclobacillus dauci]|uniref:ABC transporter permease n=1 Tax=Alicyclobacillus dauci TaxID=1475485 RepID=A0ABY6Z5X4_9BACL|nr:ABC transporter permease [Alicyclobacillus dauci]WAH37716.1 ABC transporter permease [Alicyclobacillus dauci]
MTWGQLIRKNVFRRKRLYTGYVASSSIAVMTLFMFMNFAYNPAVVHGYMTTGARDIMMVSAWMVGLFALFFIFYFHAAMLRLRSQEFGVFLVLGVTPRQLGRMVLRESFLVDGVSLVFGLALGLLFTKLFLLVLGDLLALPGAIPFAAPLTAWVFTLIAFLVIFLAEGVLMSIRIRRRGPKQMLLGARSQQKPPRASLWLAVLGLVCLAAGYYLAIFKSIQSLETLVGLLVIIALVVIGTYLLCTQLLVWVLLRMRKRVSTGVSMLVVSRLAHRMKDNARALTVIATLSAMVMTSMSSVIGLVHVSAQSEVCRDPYAVMTWENQAHPLSMSPTEITKQLTAAGGDVQGQDTTKVISGSELKATNGGKPIDLKVTIVSRSAYQRMVESIRRTYPGHTKNFPDIPSLQPGHSVFAASFPLTVPKLFDHTSARLTVGSSTASVVVVDKQINERAFNFGATAIQDYDLIVPDSDFATYLTQTPQSAVWNVHGWFVGNSDKLSNTFANKLSQQQAVITSPVETSILRAMSTMIFAGVFIALLMLLACGNTLYFRLLSNQQADRIQFRSLRRLGIQKGEVGRVLTCEFSVLFFLPFVLAGLHTVAAVIDYRHVLALPGSLWPTTLAVMGAYLAFMLIYFVIARFTYASRLMMDMSHRID